MTTLELENIEALKQLGKKCLIPILIRIKMLSTINLTLIKFIVMIEDPSPSYLKLDRLSIDRMSTIIVKKHDIVIMLIEIGFILCFF